MEKDASGTSEHLSSFPAKVQICWIENSFTQDSRVISFAKDMDGALLRTIQLFSINILVKEYLATPLHILEVQIQRWLDFSTMSSTARCRNIFFSTADIN